MTFYKYKKWKTMKLIEDNITQTLDEMYLVETLNLDNKTILELGCGNASMTKMIAQNGTNRKVIACEVDKTQHEKNLSLNIPNIEFKLNGAQDIKLDDESVDMIFMFKSFHHIPYDLMKKALKEIKRVLKPNALVYISEPLFKGEQNELIAMFHDEEQVRIDAFTHIKEAVETEEFKLFREIFFQTEVTYKDFEDFKTKQMNLSYNDNNITPQLEEKIKNKFNSYNNGKETSFMKPFRVDILQKI
ncbi:class I SAM-dependent methyltransferase [Poseidonibacter ostreae]|uniref:class I SAM-dependent methyltransferase n=1 Tax=Poseidonibacter ostreae TaxID=2654171 RepID=UPI001D0256B3|nr:class I SAM-dependent methyltransferase [Poseidonibacter ostreae]